MAHEIPPQFRAVLNPRESPAHRAERVKALHAELSTPQGLRHAAFWLPSSWPHLLQLLSDAHPEVRMAAAHLLGHFGAVLAGRREPSLEGRLSPSALIDWALAMLSPSSLLPAAQRMTADAKESALMALHACIAAMPPADVAPFAQPLLRLTTALLEATTTPPRVLGPLLRLLLAVLPVVPLAVLGQGFGDLADLLCGWALEPLVASDDRQLITLILHALRPQWHSHPDLTASLTDNMLNDVKAAAASTAAATAEGGADAAVQMASCMQLVQLLCDIFSAASLRQLPLAGLSPSEDLAQVPQNLIPQPQTSTQPYLQANTGVLLQRPSRVVLAGGVLKSTTAGQYSIQTNNQMPQKQVGLVGKHAQPGALAASPHPTTNTLGQAADAFMPKQHAPPIPPLALTAILRTRPGAATVRHLIGLYRRLLATLTEVRSSVGRLDEDADARASSNTRPNGAGTWTSRLCGCIETLVDSVASCVTGIDPRDVDDVLEGFDDDITRHLAALTLRDQGQGSTASTSASQASTVAAPSLSWSLDEAAGIFGPVGAVLAAAAPETPSVCVDAKVVNADGAARGGSEDGRSSAPRTLAVEPCNALLTSGIESRGTALRLWIFRTALEWALSSLGAAVDGEEGARPGADAEALMGCALRLLDRASAPGEARCMLLELVLEGQAGSIGVCALRSSPCASSVAAAAKLLHALLSRRELATTTLEWLLGDLCLHLAALQPGAAMLAALQTHSHLYRSPLAGATGLEGGVGDTGAAAAAAFDCAVLQAACQRGWLSDKSLFRIEALIWAALCASRTKPASQATPTTESRESSTAQAVLLSSKGVRARGGLAVLPAKDRGGTSKRTATAPTRLEQRPSLPSSVALALCDAWAAAAVGLIAVVYNKGRTSCAAATIGTRRSHEHAQPESAAAAQDARWQAIANGLAAAPPTVARACCAAYLHTIHSLQAGSLIAGNDTSVDTGLKLRTLLAVQRLIKHPVVAGSGALRCEQLFRLAMEAISAGAVSWDARIRVASAECAADLVANVLRPLQQPAPLAMSASGIGAPAIGVLEWTLAGPVTPPQPPRPESFGPLVALALDAMADLSPDVATAALRLATELSEAALLAMLRGPPSCCTWVPDWQDSLGVAPAMRAPRVQQVARLLELIFQSAATTQGNVLLRKRIPAASSAGSGAGEDGDGGGRLEALQRLALGMLPAEVSVQAAADSAGGGSTVAASNSSLPVAVTGGKWNHASGAVDRSGAALVWLALQEGSKHIVAARLRTHLGGPTQTLGVLERMLQMTYARLSQERRDAGSGGVGASGHESAWLALELVGALERAVAHAAEGHAGRDLLPQPVLAFLTANKKVCEEWFTRGRELLARIAALASAHHHVAHHGLMRLSDLRLTMRQLLNSLAKERSKAAAVSGGAPQADAKGDGAGGGGAARPLGVAGAAAASAPGSNAAVDAPSQAAHTASRHASKQLQRRGGTVGDAAPAQQPPHPSAVAPAPAAAGGAVPGVAMADEAAAAPSPMQQLESSLSRLALSVVEILKLVGSALLAMGEADSLQGLHTWAVREFEPLLQGAHLPGASALAAATAAAAADVLASGESRLGTAGLSTAKRRPEPMRGARSGGGNKHQKDAFAWLLGLSQQAAGSYEQALLSYNSFLAPAQAPATSLSATGSPGSGNGAAAAPGPSPSTALELAAAAQSFVVERVAECYAALTDWSGLQGLVGAFSRTAATESAVAGWWPAMAASIEHRFRALAAFDTAVRSVSSSELVPGDSSNTVLLAALRALEGTAAAAAPRSAHPSGSLAPLSPPPRPRSMDLAAVREATSLELDRILDQLRASALSDPAGQRQLLLQISYLRSALRSLDGELAAHGSGAAGAHGPWCGLLLPQVLHSGQVAGETTTGAVTSAGFSFGLGRGLLSPDGGLQTAVVRDVAVTAGLLRAVRASDPRAGLPGTQALLIENIRAGAATGNWSLATRLVQAAAARVSGLEVDAAAGAREVLSITHSLVCAASGRLMPGQVVELQLRALLPHLGSVDGPALRRLPPGAPLHRVVDADADDLACALCTLARWMLKAGAVASSHHSPAPASHGPHHPSHIQPHGSQRPQGADQGRQTNGQSRAGPPGFLLNSQQQQQEQRSLQHAQPGVTGTDTNVSRPSPATSSVPQWPSALDWPALSSSLLRELVSEHGISSCAMAPGPGGGGSAPAAQLAFLLPEALLQSYYAPASCCLRALQLSPDLARAWKAWGDLVFKATKEHRARAARPPPQAPSPAGGLASSTLGSSSGAAVSPTGASVDDASGAWAAVGYGAAAVAYCRYLALSFSHDTAARPEDMLPVLLQLLHIVVRHATPIEHLLEAQLSVVPPLAWSTITPQLLAQLPSASGAARRLLGLLLHAVGRAAPSLVLYPAVVEVRAADMAAATAAAAAATAASSGEAPAKAAMESSVTGASMVPELRALLADLGRSRAGLLAGVEVLVAEMERLTVLWDERWAALLAEVEVEIARRAVSLQAEASRVADDASINADQRQALLSSRYSTLMAPAVMLLERQLRVMAAMPAETPHERRFAEAVLPRLRAAAASLRDGVGVRDWARPSQAWAPLRAAAASLARQQRQPLPPIAELSPRLAALQGSEVPMPGCHADDGAGGGLVPFATLASLGITESAAAATAAMAATVTVAGVCSEVVALNTKTRPKRVALVGSDGQTYTYLLKGREDLRMDERLMQVLRAINSMLQADPSAAARGLATVRCYSVTPLGPRAGLIQWVPSTTSLFAVFRQWQAATLERHGAMVAARQEGVAKALAEGSPPPPEVEPPPPAAASRPMDLFYSTLVSALQERGLSSATPRRNWPADLLRAVFASLAAVAPRQLLARVLWAGGGSAALSWRRLQRYSRSLAVMSCVGHLLGLGDRHPDNILLEGREAGVVHIDYNVCWDKGAKLRVPEVVPFRLTQMLSTALGVGGLEGVFRAACETTFACLRRRREALVGLADAVLSDPGVDWAVEREDMAARQDMELAVALNLFVSRAEEAQRQLQQAEEDLPAVLDGPVGVLLAYVEAQAFAEAMRSAATEAQKRIQQAKSALEIASRAEAEASAIVAAAAQEAASLAAEGSSLSNAVPQLLQQCGAWAQQHAGTLGVLREGSFLEGTLASGASWRAVESGCALGLLTPVPVPGHAPLNAATPHALLPAVMGSDDLGIGQLPEELLLSCHECDRQAADVLGRREAALCEAVATLTQYGTIVRKLLPPAYPATSYHHRWAQALSALVAGGLSVPAVAQAQALAPREPRPLDVAAAWQALRGSQRLATAAAVVLAPGSPDAAAALSGHVAGVRVPGRELAGAVVAAGRTLGDAMVGIAADAQAQVHERQAAASATGAAGRAGGLVGLSTNQQVRYVAEVLQRHSPPHQRPGLGATDGGNGSNGGDPSAAAIVSAASDALLRLVRAASNRMEARMLTGQQLCPSDPQRALSHGGEPVADSATGLQDFLRLSGDVAGLAAATATLANARLSAPVLGIADPGSGLSCTRGSSTQSLTQHYLQGNEPQPGGSPHAIIRAATPGVQGGIEAAAACPLPWLAAAADICSRWPELMHRLAADVAPELAGQLHIGCGFGGAGGTGGGAGSAPAAQPDTPFAQVVADLYALIRPVEESLHAGRDAHTRFEALAELTATYQDRRADLLFRLAGGTTGDAATAGGGVSPLLTPPERESLEADLQALDAAWESRDVVAAGLSTAIATATEALAEALRRFYATVLGPGRLPVELQTYDTAAAAYAAAGMEGWAEAGGCGHAGLAALAAWWDAVTESLEGIQSCYGNGEAETVTSDSLVGVPPTMRPLWRCVEVAHMVEQSLRLCGQAVRLTAPVGTDGALAEAYSAVIQALAPRAAGYITGRLFPHLRHYLSALESQLVTSLELSRQKMGSNNNSGGGGGIGTDATSVEICEPRSGGGDVALGAGTPELVPFTDFDPRIAGEGELLGGLDDDEDEAGGGPGDSDDGAGWLGYVDGPEGVNNGDGSGGDAEGFDIDLGLDLDLDDGFGGGSEGLDEGRVGFDSPSQMEGSYGEGGSDAGSRAGGRAATAAAATLPCASPEEVYTLLAYVAACASVAAVGSVTAAIDPSAAAGQPTATSAWAAGPEARASRAARLQRLAAYEWMHEHHLLQALPAGDPRIGQALAQFFAAQAADPLQPSARVTATSRLALLTQLQSALDALPLLEQTVSSWEAASSAAVSQVMAMLRGLPERFPVDTAVAVQRAAVVMSRRQQWLAESRAVVMRLCQVSEALLQFEYSRQGITWSSGSTAMADGFAAHFQLLGRAEVLATLAAAGSEAGRAAAVAEASQRAAEAAGQAADARYALEVAQYEEVAASSQLQAHLPLLVSRSLELGSAVAEAEPAVRAVVQLLSGKLGPALKELSSVAAQHSAASDVASVAAAVTSHFERSRQAAAALAAALPATLAALVAADAAASLPADMATEVGFLSAQLLGGPAAAAATRERAMALLQHLAAPAAALQPVLHTVLELPRALGQLSNEISTLAAAAGSIAAAVESKHLLPAMDEQQQGQPEALTPPQMSSTGASSTPQDTVGRTTRQDRMPGDVAATGASTLEGSQAAAATSGSGSLLSAVKAKSATSTSALAGPSGLNRLMLQRLAHADHVQHHRSRRTAADEARRRAFAAGALRRFVAKLEGREVEGGLSAGGVNSASNQHLSVAEQVDLLVRQATSTDRLSQMYEGWTAWL